MNPNERKLIAFLVENGKATIREIAKACGWIKSLGTTKADSRVRNSLRRPRRDGLVKKQARGVYEVTGKGRASLALQPAEKATETAAAVQA